ncbi:MAG: prepilin peptidase [Amaricoccus sp.]|uniref:prepilin peptidase n=1 Tax=Amaricoccus sp. TaxID=1872485 RepID=UPI0039E53B0B
MALVLSCAAIALFLAAAATDAARRTIPNPLVVALAVLGVVRIVLGLAMGDGLGAAGLDLVAATAVFALGAGAFAAGVLGGGDAKLLAAGALWIGTGGLGGYLLATVLAGGVLAIGYVAWQFVVPRARGRGLPYALAIAVGGILATAGPLLA